MKNYEVVNYIEKANLQKNREGKDYIAEQCVKEGYGQNDKGYLKNASDRTISQKEHFVNHYGSDENKEKNPEYFKIKCPQLMLFIAEIAGVSEEILLSAYNYLKEYEDANSLRDTSKDGKYLQGAVYKGENVLSEFKSLLHISEVTEIIKQATNWEEVICKTKEIR